MIATQRFDRDGLIISALCHVAILVAVVLFFARGAPQKAVPRETVPPDAMRVEFVTPKDIPRYSGTPSTLRTSGTQQTAQSQALTAKGEQPPTVPSPPQPKDQHQAQRNAPPKPQETQAKAPLLPTADAAKVAMAQPASGLPTPSAPRRHRTRPMRPPRRRFSRSPVDGSAAAFGAAPGRFTARRL